VFRPTTFGNPLGTSKRLYSSTSTASSYNIINYL
jgi:hypothetical protein